MSSADPDTCASHHKVFLGLGLPHTSHISPFLVSLITFYHRPDSGVNIYLATCQLYRAGDFQALGLLFHFERPEQYPAHSRHLRHVAKGTDSLGMGIWTCAGR